MDRQGRKEEMKEAGTGPSIPLKDDDKLSRSTWEAESLNSESRVAQLGKLSRSTRKVESLNSES